MEGRAWLVVLSVPLVAFTLCGCVGPWSVPSAPGPLPASWSWPFIRQTSEEKERDKDLQIRVVGDFTDSNAESALNDGMLQISAVGLVTGLDGTGGTPPGPFREMLDKELRKQGLDRVREILDSPNNAMVFVSALIPAGMRRGEPIDVEITLPPGSRATSLRGGYLQKCSLRYYKIVQTNAQERFLAEKTLLAGSVMAHAQGPLMIGLGDPESAVELKRARIWKGPDQGGVLTADRPFYLVLKRNERGAHIANAVAERLNGLFREDGRQIQLRNERLRNLNAVSQQLNQTFDNGNGDVAKASTRDFIALSVPYAYQLNPERYLRLCRVVPVRETPEEQARFSGRLAKMLLDPKDTMRAALRLEALGQDSAVTLKAGLENSHPLVRFAAAESLTYLGSTAGVDELAKLAVKHRELRCWCLLALAGLDESMSRTRLTELFDNPEPELRYGAFLAARLGGTIKDPGVVGQYYASFWLHQLAPSSTPLVHISMSKRAEVVLFGSGIHLNAPFGIVAGTEFTITAGPGSDRCIVSRMQLRQEKKQLEASLNLEDILRKMAELGAQYPDVADFLRKADDRHCLSCPLRIDAVPQLTPLEALAESGARK